MPGLDLVLILGVTMLVMYFLVVRPAQRKAREQMSMRDSIAEGNRVVLTSGFFGTVRHIGDRQMVVEIAPDVLVTVMREAIMRVVAADEEEFEVASDDAEDSQFDLVAANDDGAEPSALSTTTTPLVEDRSHEDKDI